MDIAELHELCIDAGGRPIGTSCIFSDKSFEIQVSRLNEVYIDSPDKDILGLLSNIDDMLGKWCTINYIKWDGEKYEGDLYCKTSGDEREFINKVSQIREKVSSYSLKDFMDSLVKEYVFPREDKIGYWAYHPDYSMIVIDYETIPGMIHPTSVEIHREEKGDYLIGDIVVKPWMEDIAKMMLEDVGCKITEIHYHEATIVIPSTHIHIKCEGNINKVLEKIEKIMRME